MAITREVKRLPGSAGRLRRALTIVTAITFSVAFALSSLAEWATHTVLEPHYVKPTLREAGVYRLMRDETLPGWLEAKLQSFGVDDPLHRSYVISVLVTVIGEDELRQRVEHGLDQVLPYLVGDEDQFTVRPRLSEWALEIPETLARLDLPTFFVDSVLAPKLRPALGALAGDPLHVSVEPDDAQRIANEIVPPAWVDAQVVGATYAVARWATGAQRTFEIRIDYTERVDAATAVFKRLLRRSDVEQVLIDRVVLPMAEAGLADLEELSAAEIDPATLGDVVREVAPPGWLTRQVDALIDALGDWLAGRTEEVELMVQTGALSTTAGDIVVELTRRTLGDAAAQTLAAPLRERVQQYFPEETSWSTDDLRAGIGEDAYRELLRMRGFVTQGFVYTHDDLRRDLRERLGLDDAQVDGLRHVLGESYAYTEIDLGNHALGTELERTMISVRRAMAWAIPVHVLALLLLVALVIVSGPGPWHRTLWTIGTLAVAGLGVWVALTPWVASILEVRFVALIPDVDARAHGSYPALSAAARDTAAILGAFGRSVFLLASLSWVALFVLAVRLRARTRS